MSREGEGEIKSASTILRVSKQKKNKKTKEGGFGGFL